MAWAMVQVNDHGQLLSRATRDNLGKWSFAILLGCAAVAALAGAALIVDAAVGLRTVFTWAALGVVITAGLLIYRGSDKPK